MAPTMIYIKHFFNSMIDYSGITCLHIHAIKQRPFIALYLGIFLATAFLPMLAYLLFTCTIVSLGVLLLAVVESGIIAMATITLLVFLVIPACIATGLSFLGYTIYVAVSQTKTLGSSSLNYPEKRFAREDLKLRCDEKPSLEANIRSSGAKRGSKGMEKNTC